MSFVWKIENLNASNPFSRYSLKENYSKMTCSNGFAICYFCVRKKVQEVRLSLYKINIQRPKKKCGPTLVFRFGVNKGLFVLADDKRVYSHSIFDVNLSNEQSIRAWFHVHLSKMISILQPSKLVYKYYNKIDSLLNRLIQGNNYMIIFLSGRTWKFNKFIWIIAVYFLFQT